MVQKGRLRTTAAKTGKIRGLNKENKTWMKDLSRWKDWLVILETTGAILQEGGRDLGLTCTKRF
jgi:hypothetical protein